MGKKTQGLAALHCGLKHFHFGLAPNGRQKNLSNWEQAMTNPWTNKTHKQTNMTSIESNYNKLGHYEKRKRYEAGNKTTTYLNQFLFSAPNTEDTNMVFNRTRVHGITFYHSHAPEKTYHKPQTSPKKNHNHNHNNKQQWKKRERKEREREKTRRTKKVRQRQRHKMTARTMNLGWKTHSYDGLSADLSSTSIYF